ncbi:MAG TPA: sulfite exporter TauE/SafE family protein [Polyangiaceae bacterium]|nr:sulfite exporter TauE/SafE family protein [Polyangiaceae bacterium]
MNGFSILAASCVGSLHCVGMCGGLVSFYAVDAAAPASRVAPHAAYHSARLVAYVALGAAAGSAGSALDVLGSRLGLGNVGLFIAGVTLLFWAARLLASQRHSSALVALGRRASRRSPLVRRLEPLFVALASNVRQRSPVARAAALGLASALLPCGWLYAFVMLAAGSGSGAAGALTMLSFWAGTVPALLGLGVGLGRLSARLRARLPVASAAVVLVACALNVAERWPLASATEPSASPHPPSCHAAH